MFTLSLAVLALLPSANALERKDGVVWLDSTAIEITKAKGNANNFTRADCQLLVGIVGTPSDAM